MCTRQKYAFDKPPSYYKFHDCSRNQIRIHSHRVDSKENIDYGRSVQIGMSTGLH
jgi:hypothetical protein